MEWAFTLTGNREGSVDSDTSDAPRSSNDLQTVVQRMFADPQWLDDHVNSSGISTTEARLAAMILTLNAPFCKAFNKESQLEEYCCFAREGRWYP